MLKRESKEIANLQLLELHSQEMKKAVEILRLAGLESVISSERPNILGGTSIVRDHYGYQIGEPVFSITLEDGEWIVSIDNMEQRLPKDPYKKLTEDEWMIAADFIVNKFNTVEESALYVCQVFQGWVAKIIGSQPARNSVGVPVTWYKWTKR